jgi:hypothetical protein
MKSDQTTTYELILHILEPAKMLGIRLLSELPVQYGAGGVPKGISSRRYIYPD